MKEEHLALLNQAGLKDLQRAKRNLTLLAEKGIHRGGFEALLPSLLEALRNAPDPDMALNNFERYAEAVVDRGFFYSLLKENRKILDLALTIFGSSQFLSDLLVRSPHDFYWLLEPGVLRRPRPKEALDADLEAYLSRVSSFERKLSALRRFKARELLRIGLQDLLGNLDLVGVTQELSNLADISLQKAYEICFGELKRRYGIPQCRDGAYPERSRGEGRLKECRFAVIGMGKLGGSELNFSSDIDLLFVYEAEGETTGVKITNKQFFVRLGELLVKAIGEVTSEGRVFRVDMRLRPEGQAGDLALSLSAYQLYYGSYGREWERLALIKARPVAGDPELGQAFLEMVAPFVYRRSLDFGALTEIRALKEKLNLSVALEGRTYRDVKRGYGGIREIEFVVQAFQLLYGGRDPWIREANTLRALHRLSERGYLSYDDHAALAKAYTFLRTVEHRLQILHQLQTHTLPEDREELERLARRLGYRGEDPAASFLQDLKAHTEAVRRIYDRLLPERSETRDEKDELSLFFEADLPLEQIRGHLAEVGFEDVERASRGFLALRDGPPFTHYSPESRKALAKLAPQLLQALKQAPDPDLALIHFERFLEVSGARGTLLEFLGESPGLFALLIRLFGLSEPLSQVLILHPELLDLLVDPDALKKIKSKEELVAELRGAVKGTGGSGRLDALRRVKRAEELRLGLQDLLGFSDPSTSLRAGLSQIHRGFTALAESCLEVALELAQEELAERFGLPHSSFAIIGLGKLGGGELAYGSDLDVVFVYEKEGSLQGGLSYREYFTKLADRVIKVLTAITQEGSAYKVDPRLRPGGQKGELAQPLRAYGAYFASEASVWERQAYLKARPVAGDGTLGRRFVELIHPFLFREEEQLAAKIDGMRRRMEEERVKGKGIHVKLGSGGLVEVEFTVQFLQLQYGRGRPELWEPNTLSALEKLTGAGLMPKAEAKRLQESYLFLRRVEEKLRIAAGLNVGALPPSRDRLRKLAKSLGYEGADADERFLTDYTFHTKAVRGIYQQTLAKCGLRI